MTLPYPDKPAITDTISTIISNIKDNLDSIESEPKYKAVTFTKNLAVEGNVSTTGVGFPPRMIIFFAEEPAADVFTWGIYCYGSTYPDIAFYVNSAGEYAISFSGIRFGVVLGDARAFIASRDADGFTLTWEHANGAPTGTATIIAFCIR